MNSPLHPQTRLQAQEIEPGLSAYECPKSGGVWIPLDSYLQWKEQHSKDQDDYVPQGDAPVLDDDSKQPILICPESGRFLLRYRVGHGLEFRVDQSPATGGVWLNKGEWEALKSKGLHTQLNMIFTAAYQRDLRSGDYWKTVEQVFQQRIGAADMEKVAQFKEWMSQHPHRDDILRYLMQTSEQIEPE